LVTHINIVPKLIELSPIKIKIYKRETPEVNLLTSVKLYIGRIMNRNYDIIFIRYIKINYFLI